MLKFAEISFGSIGSNRTHVQRFRSFFRTIASSHPVASKIYDGTSLRFKSKSVGGAVIGVDMGTTSSRVAVIVGKEAKVLENAKIRYFSTVSGQSKEEKEPELEKEKTVIEYQENFFKRFHCRVPNQNPTNFGEAMELVGFLRGQLDTANEALSLEQIRRVMETFEFDNFPHPWDLNYSARKVTFDHAKLNALTGDDKKQEIRFQKMRFYLSNNPNQALQNLVKMLKSLNISIDEFALGYAKAYRDISERIHRSIIKPKPIDPYDFFLEQSAIDATIILMKTCGINERLIELFSKLQKK